MMKLLTSVICLSLLIGSNCANATSSVKSNLDLIHLQANKGYELARALSEVCEVELDLEEFFSGGDYDIPTPGFLELNSPGTLFSEATNLTNCAIVITFSSNASPTLRNKTIKYYPLVNSNGTLNFGRMTCVTNIKDILLANGTDVGDVPGTLEGSLANSCTYEPSEV